MITSQGTRGPQRAAVARRQRDPHGDRGARPRSPTSPIGTSRSTGSIFREVVSVTTIEGGVAANVIPDRVQAHGELPLRARRTLPPRPKRGCASCSGPIRGSRCEIVGNAPPGPVNVHEPAGEPAPGGRRSLTLGPKQAWTPVAEFATIGRGRGQLRTGRPAVRSSGRRTRRGGRARPFVRGAARGSWVSDRTGRPRRREGARSVTHLSPGIRNVEPYPFEELDRRKADGARRGPRADRLRRGRPARGHRARSSARRCGAPSSRSPRTRARRGFPSCAGRSRAGLERRFEVTVDPETAVLPLLGFEGDRVLARAGGARSRAAARTSCSSTAPGYTIPERGARFAGGEVLRLPLTRGATGSCPTSTRSTTPRGTGRRSCG